MPKIRNKLIRLAVLTIAVFGGYLVHGFLSIAHEDNSLYTNYGISFGLNVVFLVPILLLGLPAITWWWIVKEKEWSWLLLLVGGYVNLIDRIIYQGGVRDYWRIPGLGIYNNLGDWLIFAGVLISLFKLRKC